MEDSREKTAPLNFSFCQLGCVLRGYVLRYLAICTARHASDAIAHAAVTGADTTNSRHPITHSTAAIARPDAANTRYPGTTCVVTSTRANRTGPDFGRSGRGTGSERRPNLHRNCGSAR